MPRRALNEAATESPATKIWTTLGTKTTAMNRPGRSYFTPGDVKNGGTAVWQQVLHGWPTRPPPPLSAINDIVKNPVPYRRPASSDTAQKQRGPTTTPPAKKDRSRVITHD